MYLYAKNDKGKVVVYKMAIEKGLAELDDSIPYIETTEREIDNLVSHNKKKYHHFNYWYDEKADEIAFENIPFTDEEKEQAIKEEEEQANRPPYRKPSFYNIMQDTEKIDGKTDTMSETQMIQLESIVDDYIDRKEFELDLVEMITDVYIEIIGG